MAKTPGGSSQAPGGAAAAEAARVAGLTWRAPNPHVRAWSLLRTRLPKLMRPARRGGAGLLRSPLTASQGQRFRRPCSSTRGMAWTSLRLPAPHRWASSHSRPPKPRRPRCLPLAMRPSRRSFGNRHCLLAACLDPRTRRRKDTRGRTPGTLRTPRRRAPRGSSWSRPPGADPRLRRPRPRPAAPCSCPTCAAPAGRPLHPNRGPLGG